MAKRKSKLSGDLIDPYRQAYSRSELEAYRRKYAKRANQRMVRLERAGMTVNEPVREYLTQIGRNRYSEQRDYKGSLQQLKREIASLTGFLESERSTVRGRKKIAKKTRKTMKDRYGVDLSEKETEYLLNNFDDFKEAVNMNSDALLQAIGEVSGDVDSKEKIDKIVKELRGKKSVEERAQAIHKAVYGRKRAGKAEVIGKIAKAIIR